MTRAVFVDRDGVINRAIVRDGKPYPPQSIEVLEICDGVAEGLQALRDAGFRTIVVTNQPDVGAGLQTRAAVDAIHEYLRAQLPLDDVRVCFHTDLDHCGCRKPKPGMLLEAATEWNINLPASFMVGDRWRDVEAGRAAGCRTVLVGSGYDERQAEGFDSRAASLLDASRWILAQE